MGLTARDSGGGDFTPAPEGTHPATCMAVIDLGTQYNERWKKQQHKVLIGWELDTDEKRGDGEPFIAWRRYTMSLHEKAGLRKDLEAWRGRKFTTEELAGFDLHNILGKPCVLTITHTVTDGNTYANVASVAALPKRMGAPASVAKQILFDVDSPDMGVFSEFSEKLQEKIRACAEWRDANGGTAAGPIGDEPPPHGEDDIPF